MPLEASFYRDAGGGHLPRGPLHIFRCVAIASKVPWSCSKFVLSSVRVDKCSWLDLFFHPGNSHLSACSQLACLCTQCGREGGSLWSSLYCGVSLLWVGLDEWLVMVSWLRNLVFWWVELDFFSLECNEVSSNELCQWVSSDFGQPELKLRAMFLCW